MKELLLKDKTEVVSQIEKQEEQNKGLIGSWRITIDGGTVFEYDSGNNTIAPCDWEYDEVLVLGEKPRKKVIVKENCIYVEALNVKNAVRRMKKGRWLFHTIKK